SKRRSTRRAVSRRGTPARSNMAATSTRNWRGAIRKPFRHSRDRGRRRPVGPRCVLRDTPLRRAPQDEVFSFRYALKPPHPEEPAERASRRTHSAPCVLLLRLDARRVVAHLGLVGGAALAVVELVFLQEFV